MSIPDSIEIPSWVDAADPGMPDPEIYYRYGDATSIASIDYLDTNGDLHRSQGPARIMWYENGTRQKEVWYQHGNKHREDGPAEIEWHENGVKKSEAWYQVCPIKLKNKSPLLVGRWHRADGPALIEWYDNGQIKAERWWLDGMRHRNDGPSFRHWNREGILVRDAWRVGGNELSEIEIEIAKKNWNGL